MGPHPDPPLGPTLTPHRGSSIAQMEEHIESMVGNFSEGGAGGFFFLSADERYLIKTVSRHEQKVLLRMLPMWQRPVLHRWPLPPLPLQHCWMQSMQSTQWRPRRHEALLHEPSAT